MKKQENFELINVYQDSYTLWQFCKENNLTDYDYDEWAENGGELSFFEGDPDMIKLDGDTGYFAKCESKIFYYCDDFQDDRVRGILRDFFTGGDYCHWGYYNKFLPEKRFPTDCQNWDAWERMNNAIAYRGGCGYTYNILPLAA